jgi:hypothetical protein
MTVFSTASSSNGVLSAKKTWTAPSVQVLDLNSAQGSQPGTKSDKVHSLSLLNFVMQIGLWLG